LDGCIFGRIRGKREIMLRNSGKCVPVENDVGGVLGDRYTFQEIKAQDHTRVEVVDQNAVDFG